MTESRKGGGSLEHTIAAMAVVGALVLVPAAAALAEEVAPSPSPVATTVAPPAPEPAPLIPVPAADADDPGRSTEPREPGDGAPTTPSPPAEPRSSESPVTTPSPGAPAPTIPVPSPPASSPPASSTPSAHGSPTLDGTAVPATPDAVPATPSRPSPRIVPPTSAATSDRWPTIRVVDSSGRPIVPAGTVVDFEVCAHARGGGPPACVTASAALSEAERTIPGVSDLLARSIVLEEGEYNRIVLTVALQCVPEGFEAPTARIEADWNRGRGWVDTDGSPDDRRLTFVLARAGVDPGPDGNNRPEEPGLPGTGTNPGQGGGRPTPHPADATTPPPADHGDAPAQTPTATAPQVRIVESPAAHAAEPSTTRGAQQPMARDTQATTPHPAEPPRAIQPPITPAVEPPAAPSPAIEPPAAPGPAIEPPAAPSPAIEPVTTPDPATAPTRPTSERPVAAGRQTITVSPRPATSSGPRSIVEIVAERLSTSPLTPVIGGGALIAGLLLAFAPPGARKP